VTGVALAVEGGLGLLALAAGFLLGHSPLSSLRWSLAAAGWGVVATLPMVLGLVIVERASWRPLRRVSQVVTRLVRELFARTPLLELALISAAAGLGEEMLFRGLLQDGLARAIGGSAGVPIALVVASVAFGVAHPVTPTYALLGAQRNTKILGIFTRLAIRDGKPQYLQHIPRIRAYLARNLGHPALSGLKRWYDAHLPAKH